MGADVKAIRNRIRSVESTMHITKAMELVASSKLRHATERMERSRFFFETLVASLSDFGEGIAECSFAPRKEVKRRALVVIAGDRGLAGGYNNNVFKTALTAVSDGLRIRRAETIYEPSAAAVLDAITPEYLSGMIWGAVCESFTSELAARRTAMDAASKNASEMIDTLSLKYNRARQSAITQEITEIIGGSEQQ